MPLTLGISWKPMLSPSGPTVKRTIIRQQIDGFLMLHVKLERENTWYVPGLGWFHVRRPDTRYVRDTVPSASTVHVRCRDFE